MSCGGSIGAVWNQLCPTWRAAPDPMLPGIHIKGQLHQILLLSVSLKHRGPVCEDTTFPWVVWVSIPL